MFAVYNFSIVLHITIALQQFFNVFYVCYRVYWICMMQHGINKGLWAAVSRLLGLSMLGGQTKKHRLINMGSSQISNAIPYYGNIYHVEELLYIETDHTLLTNNRQQFSSILDGQTPTLPDWDVLHLFLSHVMPSSRPGCVSCFLYNSCDCRSESADIKWWLSTEACTINSELNQFCWSRSPCGTAAGWHGTPPEDQEPTWSGSWPWHRLETTLTSN